MSLTRPAGWQAALTWGGLLALWSILVIVPFAAAKEIPQTQIENRRCMNCHGQERIGQMAWSERSTMVAPTTQPIDPRSTEPRVGLFVDGEMIGKSVHAGVSCVGCHEDAQTLPHTKDLGSPTCNSSCHAGAKSDYLQGAHAAAVARGEKLAPTCATCHGTHDILPPTDRASKTFPLNIVKVCSDCHAQYEGTLSNGSNGKDHVEHYLDSVHGRAVAQGGLAVAATCAACHDEHKVLPSSDPASTVHRANVAATCGRCHVGVSEEFATSIHASAMAAGNEQAPDCTSCHTGHGITRTDAPAFLLDVVAECGTCHADLYDTYARSYHGQVTQLGSTRAARCSDCHGAHGITAIDAPASPLNAQNKAETCQSCHPGASAEFASFAPHADMHDRENYPILHGVWLYFVIMMSFAFGFFGLHSILWFIRSAIERIKHGPHPKFRSNPHAIQRFNRVDRINHAFVIISFFGLTLTGLPLLYADQAWGKNLASMLGGVHGAGLLHRIFAVMLIGNFVVHGVGVVRRMRRYGFFKLVFGPATMLPRWKDVTDCAGMWRWFLKGGDKPRFDRWTYWEKFDYVAEVGGSAIIGISGLLLWFPEFFSHIVPGWMFNVATIVHGYEALLAIGFIFTIHFFNAHLRLEKFPVDDVMFTGRLPEEEFKHERPEEYERLVASGELEALKVKPAPAWYRRAAVAAGILAMVIGTTLVALIVLAGLRLIQ